MTTLGEIFQRYGPAYRARFGRSLSPSQLQAMQAIEACRTEALGGQVSTCPAGQFTRYSYHSCRNRHCPPCQQDAPQAWLVEQHALLLPGPYFLLTFTLPSQLRAIAGTHPETIEPLLFRTSAAALQQLAQDPRFLGGQIGMLGVLQTWTRDLRYQPHVHDLVPALALTPDAKRWLVGKHDFLVHVTPLGELFGAKFRVGLGQRPWASQVDVRAWAKCWVVDCRPPRSGVSALNFIGRFLAQVLPKGFVKVRSYGLLHPSKRALLAELRSILALQQAAPPQPGAAAALEPLVTVPDVDRCPSCGQPMHLLQTRPPKRPHERLVTMLGAVSRRGPPDPAQEYRHR